MFLFNLYIFLLLYKTFVFGALNTNSTLVEEILLHLMWMVNFGCYLPDFVKVFSRFLTV